jgi:hypothetical protein
LTSFGILVAGGLGLACCIILLLPWLRTVPGLGALPALPWQAGLGALLTLAAVLGLGPRLRHPDLAGEPRAVVSAEASGTRTAAADTGAGAWSGIANALESGTGPMSVAPGPASQPAAQPMSAAVASLQARLAKGGGSTEDWELLAKSYEFLGRSGEASKARAHQLSSLPAPQEVSK